MDMPKQQVGFYVWQPRQNHCLDFLRQIGAMPSGYGTTTWHFDFATSSFSIKLFFSISFYMFYCFMEMFCIFLFSRRIVLIQEWLFWFGKNCSGLEGVVLNCRADPRKTRISVWKKSGAERGLSPRAREAQWKQVASAISFRAAEGYWKDETKPDSVIWLHRP